MNAYFVIILSLVALAMIVPKLQQSNSEHYTASAINSDYPRLIYNVPPYLPVGADFYVNYNNLSYTVPTSLPPHLVQGSFYAPQCSTNKLCSN